MANRPLQRPVARQSIPADRDEQLDEALQVFAFLVEAIRNERWQPAGDLYRRLDRLGFSTIYRAPKPGKGQG